MQVEYINIGIHIDGLYWYCDDALMQIEIPEPLLKRLQKHATPFVDTPVNVIERWADFYEQHNCPEATFKSDAKSSNGRHAQMEIPSGLRQFEPKRPPSLLHT